MQPTLISVPPMVSVDPADPNPGAQFIPETSGARPTIGDPVLGGMNDRGAYPKFRIQHQWPRRALDQGISGWVTIGFTITRAGSVREAYVIESSHKMFERNGLEAVSAYKYEPTIVQGRPIESSGQTVRVVWEITGS